MSDLASKQVANNNNPTGKGGFGEHPENITHDGRTKNQERYGYWLDYFKNLNQIDFINYPNEHNDMSMAAIGAWNRMSRTIKHLDEFKEVANRTEGLPKASMEITGELKTLLVEYVEPKELIDGKGEDTNTEGV